MSLAQISRLRSKKTSKANKSNRSVRSKNVHHFTLREHQSNTSFIRNFNQDQRVLSATHHDSQQQDANDPWTRMTKCLYNAEPLTVRMALLELSEHFNQSTHDTTSHLNALGAALIDVMSSSVLGMDLKMIASSMVHQCVAKHPDADKTPWIRRRAMHILSNSMLETFNFNSKDGSVKLNDRNGEVSSRLLSSIIPWLNTYHLWCASETSTHTHAEVEEEKVMFSALLHICNSILGGKATYSEQEKIEQKAGTLPISPPPVSLLQVTVLKSLAVHIGRTPTNRHMLADIITTTRHLAFSVIQKSTSLSKTQKTMDILLRRSITLFLATWYPIPCDTLVRCLPSSAFPHENKSMSSLSTSHTKYKNRESANVSHQIIDHKTDDATEKDDDKKEEEEDYDEEEEEDSVIGYLARRRRWLHKGKYWINDASISSQKWLTRQQKKHSKKAARSSSNKQAAHWSDDAYKYLFKEKNLGGRPNDMNDINIERTLLTSMLRTSLPTSSETEESAVDIEDQRKQNHVLCQIVPPRGELSLRCSSVIKYNTTTYKKTITIQNVSTTRTHKWILQIHPPQYFMSDVGFGILAPSATTEIVVTFRPNAVDVRRASQRIEGWIRLRTWWGIDLQRISLHAYNAPLLRTSTSELHFGYCVPKNEANQITTTVNGENGQNGDGSNHINHSVFRTLVVTNVGAIRSNCMVQMPLDSDLHGCFQVRPTFAVLDPGSTQTFVVEFAPVGTVAAGGSGKSDHKGQEQQSRRYCGTMNVVGTGSETYPVTLDGTAGSWFRLSSSFYSNAKKSSKKSKRRATLDFGNIDTFGTVATRQITLHNPSSRRTLPVTLQPSDTATIFLLPTEEDDDYQDDHNEHNEQHDEEKKEYQYQSRIVPWTVLVPPGTSKVVTIAYIGAIPGDIVEHVRLYAPCSVPSIIHLSGFVGKRVETPYASFQDIFIPLKKKHTGGDRRHQGSASLKCKADMMIPLINRSSVAPCEFRLRLGTKIGHDSNVIRLSIDAKGKQAEHVLHARSLLYGDEEEENQHGMSRMGQEHGIQLYEHSILILRHDDRLFLKPNEYVVIGIDIYDSKQKNKRSQTSSIDNGSGGNEDLGHYRIPMYVDCLSSPGSSVANDSGSSGSSSNGNSNGNRQTSEIICSYGPWYLSSINENLALKSMPYLMKTRMFLDLKDAHYLSEVIPSGSMVVTDVLKDWLEKVKRDEDIFLVLSPSLSLSKSSEREIITDDDEETEEEEEKTDKEKTLTKIKPSLSSILSLSSPSNTLFVSRYAKMPMSTSIEIVIKNESKYEQIFHILVTRPLQYSGAPADGLLKSGGEMRLYVSVDASHSVNNSNNSCVNTPSPMGGMTDASLSILDGLFVQRCVVPLRILYVDDHELLEENSSEQTLSSKLSSPLKISTPDLIESSLLSICHGSLYTLQVDDNNNINRQRRRRRMSFLDFGSTCSIGEDVQHTCGLFNRSGVDIEWTATLLIVTKGGTVISRSDPHDDTSNNNNSANDGDVEYHLKTNEETSTDSLSGILDAFAIVRLSIVVQGKKKRSTRQQYKNICYLVIQCTRKDSSRVTIIMSRPIRQSIEYPRYNENDTATKITLLDKTPSGIINFGDVECDKERDKIISVAPYKAGDEDRNGGGGIMNRIPLDVPWSVISEGAFTIVSQRKKTVDNTDNTDTTDTTDNISRVMQGRSTQGVLLVPNDIPLNSSQSSVNVHVRFQPSANDYHTSTISFVRKNIIEDMVVTGRAGNTSLTSNYGKPSSPSFSSNNNKQLIDLGIFHCNHRTTRTLSILNDGTLDIRIINIQSLLNDQPVDMFLSERNLNGIEPPGLFEYDWKLIHNLRDVATGIDLVEKNVVTFGNEHNNRNHHGTKTDKQYVEVDWDEVDYVLDAERLLNESNNELNSESENNDKSDKLPFSMVLRPGQRIQILLIFQTKTIGRITETPSLAVVTERSGEHLFHFTAIAQPPLTFQSGSSVSFGVVPHGLSKKRSLEFTNIGAVAVPWSIHSLKKPRSIERIMTEKKKKKKVKESTFVSDNIDEIDEEDDNEEIAKSNKSIDQENLNRIIGPYTLIPHKGLLEPGETQHVIVEYTGTSQHVRTILDLGLYSDPTALNALNENIIESDSSIGNGIDVKTKKHINPSSTVRLTGTCGDALLRLVHSSVDFLQKIGKNAVIDLRYLNEETDDGNRGNDGNDDTDDIDNKNDNNDNDDDETAPSIIQYAKEISLDYGAIKISGHKTISLYLVNVGDVECPFNIIFPYSDEEDNELQKKNHNNSSRNFVKKGWFTCTPSHGTINGRSSRQINIRFVPLSEKEQFDTLHIEWGSPKEQHTTNVSNAIENSTDNSTTRVTKNIPLVVRVFGGGGTPSLQILSNTLDYGTSMLGITKTKEFVIKNVGNAETLCEIKHLLETEDKDKKTDEKINDVHQLLLMNGSDTVQQVAKPTPYTLTFTPRSPFLIRAHSTKIVQVQLTTSEPLSTHYDILSKNQDPSILLPSIDTQISLRSTESIHEHYRIHLISKIGRPSINLLPYGYFQGSTTSSIQQQQQNGSQSVECFDFHTVLCGSTHRSTFQLQNNGGVPITYACLFATLSKSSKTQQFLYQTNKRNNSGKNDDDDIRIEREEQEEEEAEMNQFRHKSQRADRWLQQNSGTTLNTMNRNKIGHDALSQLYQTNSELFLLNRRTRNPGAVEVENIEELEESIFRCTPSSGIVEVGATVSIELEYTPKKQKRSPSRSGIDEQILLIKMPNITLCGMIRGRGGVPSLIFHIDPIDHHIFKKEKKKKKKKKNTKNKSNKKNKPAASHDTTIIDFGTCRTGSVHNRVIHIINVGHMTVTNLTIEPDPSYNSTNTSNASNSDKNSSSNLQQENPFSADDWQKRLHTLGYQCLLTIPTTKKMHSQSSSTTTSRSSDINSNDIAALHIRYSAKTPQYNTINTITLRMRLRYTTTMDPGSPIYKNFILHSRADTARITLLNSKKFIIRNSIEKGILFPHIIPVGESTEQIFYLQNQGTFASEYFISETSLLSNHGAYTIRPKRGTLPPKSTTMIHVQFTPKKDGEHMCLLKIRTNAHAPPTVGNDTKKSSDSAGDAYGSHTQIVELRLSGRGGLGRLKLHYVTTKDRNLSGLDYGYCLNNHVLRKTIVLENEGNVCTPFVARVRSPFYSVTRLPNAIVTKNQTGEEQQRNSSFSGSSLPSAVSSSSSSLSSYSVKNTPSFIEKRKSSTHVKKQQQQQLLRVQDDDDNDNEDIVSSIENDDDIEEIHCSNDDISSQVISKLEPGQTMALSVVLNACSGNEHHSYVGVLVISTMRNLYSKRHEQRYVQEETKETEYKNKDIVGSDEEHKELEEQHLTASLRGIGGTLMLKAYPFERIHLGIVPLNQKITKQIHLLNRGTLPCAVKFSFMINPSEIDKFRDQEGNQAQNNQQEQQLSEMLLNENDDSNGGGGTFEKNVGHTVLLRTLGTSMGRRLLWKRAYSWVVNMIRIEKLTRKRNYKNETNAAKKNQGNNPISMKQLKKHASVLHATKRSKDNNHKTNKKTANTKTKSKTEATDPRKITNPFEELRRKGDEISASTSTVVNAYSTLRKHYQLNFNLDEEMKSHFVNNDLNEYGSVTASSAASSSGASLIEQKSETSLTAVLNTMKNQKYSKKNLYRRAPSSSTPHLRIYPASIPSISHSMHGTRYNTLLLLF